MAPLFTKDLPPAWEPDAVATDQGWESTRNVGEILVSWGGLNLLGASANITLVEFSQDSYEGGDDLSVTVHFNEKVDVTSGASLVVTFDGNAGDITLYAEAQLATGAVVFSKLVDETTQETVPVSVAASATLTSDTTNVADGATVTIGSTVYTFKDDVNVKATGTLTLTGNAIDGETVTIGSNVYTFQDTLTNVAGNVLIGLTASDSLDNLIAAITAGAGSGTAYAAATSAHPTVTASAGSGDTMVVTAKTGGTAGNAIATTETLTDGSFAAVTLTLGAAGAANRVKVASGSYSGSLTNLFHAINASGGTAGTDYSAATVAHADVVATNPTAATVHVTAKEVGTDGNGIAIAETSAHLSWSGSGFLLGGISNDGTFSISAQTVSGTITDYNSKLAATGVLTLTGLPLDDETVVVGSKTYTFKDTLASTNGQVKIQPTVEGNIAALVSAINLGPGSGHLYASGMTLNANVSAAETSNSSLTVTAKVAGAAGNSIGSTETLTNGSWGGSTLSGGADSVASTKTISSGVAIAAGTPAVA